MESIRDLGSKINPWFAKYRNHEGDITLVLILLLIGSLGFGLGRLSKLSTGRQPLRVEIPAAVGESTAQNPPPSPTLPATLTVGQVVASKNSTKYHLPSCAGAKAIKDENKIWFASAEEAKAAGFVPAANCPGL